MIDPDAPTGDLTEATTPLNAPLHPMMSPERDAIIDAIIEVCIVGCIKGTVRAFNLTHPQEELNAALQKLVTLVSPVVDSRAKVLRLVLDQFEVEKVMPLGGLINSIWVTPTLPLAVEQYCAQSTTPKFEGWKLQMSLMLEKKEIVPDEK